MVTKSFLVSALLIAAPTVATAQVGGVAVPLPAQDGGSGPAKPKLICKTSVDTGSLVNHTRRCYSADDWQRLTEGHRALAQKLVFSQAAGMTTN